MLVSSRLLWYLRFPRFACYAALTRKRKQARGVAELCFRGGFIIGALIRIRFWGSFKGATFRDL